MRVGSLFSGIGGFDLGLERSGMQIEWQVENNEYCREVLKKHWPSIPCHYDIRSIAWDYVCPVDLVCGGFPCQPFSAAGKRRGADDDRYLWPEVVRCLAVLRPTWFVGENVYGLLHLGIEQMYADLEALGYQVAILGIPACAVDAPHLRKRIWIIAHSNTGIEPNMPEHEQRGIQGAMDVGDASELRRRQRDADAGRNSERARAKKERAGSTDGMRWPIEPGICRVVDGVPNRSHRLRGLGNAIVPQIAEALGKMILEVDVCAGRPSLSGITPD